MKCYEYTIDMSQINFKHIDMNTSVFFDIETTGFSAKNSYLYLIGCLYKNATTNSFILKQWFLDDINTEKELLIDFMDFIKNYTTLISFNGDGFDIPFVNQRLNKYKLLKNLDSYESVDLYKEANNFKNMFKLPNLKLKTIEQFLGINREDPFTGGDLINVYRAYLESKDERLLKTLLLHNYEDVKAMPTLLNIYSYRNILDGEFVINEITSSDADENSNKKEVIIKGSLHNNIMSRISFGYGDFYFTAYDNTFKLMVNVYDEQLKLFYKDFKDYYYLPNEDMAMHKSVARYVDKNYRDKATITNCYSKIKLDDVFIHNNDAIKKYVLNIIDFLLRV